MIDGTVCKRCGYQCQLTFRDLYNVWDPERDTWHPRDLADCMCVNADVREKNCSRHMEMQFKESEHSDGALMLTVCVKCKNFEVACVCGGEDER